MCPCLCQTDPFWTASSLSPSDHREAQNQSICSLDELLELAKGNATLLLNLREPPRDHPFRSSFINVTLETLLRSGFPQHQVSPDLSQLLHKPGHICQIGVDAPCLPDAVMVAAMKNKTDLSGFKGQDQIWVL